MRFRLDVDGEAREIDVERTDGGVVVLVDNARYRARSRLRGDSTEIRIGAKTYRVRLRGNDAILEHRVHRLRIAEVHDVATERAEGPRREIHAVVAVHAPMPGRVVRVAVTKGDRVRRGQTLIVLEAMKMQNEIVSPGDGIVRSVDVSEFETVTADRIVASVELTGPLGS